MVLSDVDKVQLVLPFEQSDAAQVKPNQKVTVQADAVPDSELTGHGRLGRTVEHRDLGCGQLLRDGRPGPRPNSKLKDGQTGRGTVHHPSNVRTCSACRTAPCTSRATTTTVVLLSADGTQQTVPFEAGAVGSDRTEVLSGLTEGQHVVLPDGAVTSPRET